MRRAIPILLVSSMALSFLFVPAYASPLTQDWMCCKGFSGTLYNYADVKVTPTWKGNSTLFVVQFLNPRTGLSWQSTDDSDTSAYGNITENRNGTAYGIALLQDNKVLYNSNDGLPPFTYIIAKNGTLIPVSSSTANSQNDTVITQPRVVAYSRNGTVSFTVDNLDPNKPFIVNVSFYGFNGSPPSGLGSHSFVFDEIPIAEFPIAGPILIGFIGSLLVFKQVNRRLFRLQ